MSILDTTFMKKCLHFGIYHQVDLMFSKQMPHLISSWCNIALFSSKNSSNTKTDIVISLL
jgi:hypothetical protein